MVLEEHEPEVEDIGAGVSMSSPSPCIGEEGGEGVGESGGEVEGCV